MAILRLYLLFVLFVVTFTIPTDTTKKDLCRVLLDGTKICVTSVEYLHELDLAESSVIEQSKCGTPLGVKGGGIHLLTTDNRGLGVFATSGYKEGDVIELCPTHSFSYTHNRGDKKDRNTAVDRFDLVLLGQLNLEQADMGVGEQSKVAKELAKAISILKLYGLQAFGSGQHHSYLSGGYCGFSNHGGREHSNAAFMDRLCDGRTSTAMYAVRDIAAGEEILWNYGDKYFDSSERPVHFSDDSSERPVLAL